MSDLLSGEKNRQIRVLCSHGQKAGDSRKTGVGDIQIYRVALYDMVAKRELFGGIDGMGDLGWKRIRSPGSRT